jgi:hypothetical protein
MSTVPAFNFALLPAESSRSNPIAFTMERIKGYPKKLVIYRIQASSYWWVRYYADGRYYKRSCGTDVRRDAIQVAKRFYDEINFKIHQGLAESGTITFDAATRDLLESEKAKVDRRQLTQITYDVRKYRFDKTVTTFFKDRDIARIDYTALDEFLNHLSKDPAKLSVSTIAAYMGLVKAVLTHAARKRWIHHVPEFPKVGVDDRPRGWFRIGEYKQLYKRARQLAGKTAERIRSTDANGEFVYHHVLKGKERNGERRRSVKITPDLRDMIVFMVNSYIRPTDLKNMQHKHVDVVKNEWHYLRLNLPPSKGHKFPITTMPWAVRVYARITKRNSKRKLAGPEDYVFMPEYGEKSRGYALKMLQYQFDALLDLLDMKNSPQGEPRTIYSLRHSSIMFRLLYGASIDTLKLARNARTSPEMIDRFYAAPLMGEMAIQELQAKRRPRPWER